MRAEDIPDFVSAILAAGAPICAIGHDIYLICETEVPDEMVEQVVTKVQEVCDRYGPREHLRREIAAHLRSLGCYVEVGELPPVRQPN
jgi:hypothetical protein